MKKILQLSLGIMASAGGFLDIGDLVFGVQAGAKFGYGLLWALLLGLIGIIVFSEMCGRIVAVTGKPVFVLVRERFGRGWGLATLIGSMLVNVITCAAEIGGVALVLQLLTNSPYRLLIIAAVVIFVLLVWLTPIDGLERIFGFLGLMLVVFIVAAFQTGPDWGGAVRGLIPQLPSANPLIYWYFAVGLMAATLMPYEVYFYAAGGAEDRWTTKDIPLNRFVAIAGYGLGSLLAVGLIMMAAQFMATHSLQPEYIGTTVLGALAPLGKPALVVALLGVLFTIGGAAVETALSAAYNLAHFFSWKWSKNEPPSKVPRFTLAWIGTFLAAGLIILTGIDPVQLAEYAVVFSVAVMPPTYLAILLVARDPRSMGSHANGRLANTLGWLGFAVVLIVAVSAVPLMILTRMGQG